MILAFLRWLFGAPTSDDYEAASPGLDHTHAKTGE